MGAQKKALKLVQPGDGGFSAALDRPQLQVLASDLPATARELRDLLAKDSNFYDRGGVLVRLAHAADGGAPVAIEVTTNDVIFATHKLCQPMAWKGDDLKAVTLPDRLADMYLDMRGEWHVPPLEGITTAPVLSDDGAIFSREGYDPETRLWCAKVPELEVPDRPSRADAEAALQRLRTAFRTFPFGDSPRVPATPDRPALVDTSKPPGVDETIAVAGLMTSVCRACLYLAPGLLVDAAQVSGSGAGKGLLVRAMCAIAFGVRPSAWTPGAEKTEFDKRLVSDLIAAAPAILIDNVNNTSLKSNTLASVMTERPAKVRMLGKSKMPAVNSTAFIAITGNGLSVSEDLARRFLPCHLDPEMEDPETRPFKPGYLNAISARRCELLSAVLTIWRWGRQNDANLARGRPIGSFETWAEWVRDPLLTLGCPDPLQRMLEAKASDPARKKVIALFETWYDHHHDTGMLAKHLHEDVRAIADEHGRGRQWLASYLDKLANTRAAGFVLKQQKPVGKWGTTTYKLEVVDAEGVRARAEARRRAEHVE